MEPFRFMSVIRTPGLRFVHGYEGNLIDVLGMAADMNIPCSVIVVCSMNPNLIEQCKAAALQLGPVVPLRQGVDPNDLIVRHERDILIFRDASITAIRVTADELQYSCLRVFLGGLENILPNYRLDLTDIRETLTEIE